MKKYCLCWLVVTPRFDNQGAIKTGGIAADVEAYEGSETGSADLRGSHWISIAAANVLPKVRTAHHV